MRSMMAVMLLLGISSLNVAQEHRTIHREGVYNDPYEQNLFYRPDIPVAPRSDAPEPPPVVANGTVSVRDLEIPGKAAKEFERARGAFRKGDLNGTVEHLEKAVARTPEWPAGHFELGRTYLRLNENDRAIEEFRRTTELDPKHWLALDSWAAVLCIEKRSTEAEPLARRALEVQPNEPVSEYLLGSILVAEGKDLPEATQLLEKTKGQFPRAKLFLAQAAMKRGANDEAKEILREYLKAPVGDDERLVQMLLEQLKTQTASNGKEPGWRVE